MSTTRAVVVTMLVALVLSGCAAVPDTFTCSHCACLPAERSLSRPMLCSTVRRDPECCTPMFLGS